MVGKSDFKENPQSDLDLDLGFVKNEPHLPLSLRKFEASAKNRVSSKKNISVQCVCNYK